MIPFMPVLTALHNIHLAHTLMDLAGQEPGAKHKPQGSLTKIPAPPSLMPKVHGVRLKELEELSRTRQL
jgi:hypothetical protein